MGIYSQPNAWLCGPFALKHALLTVGIFEDEWSIARDAGTDQDGTDEIELAKAARVYGCDLGMLRRHHAEDARGELIRCLVEGHPVLLCVEQWDHWVTVVHHENGVFVLFDSRDPAVIREVAWGWLAEKWRYREESGEAHYDLHPLVPRRPAAVATFSLRRTRALVSAADPELRRRWGRYGRGLITLACATGSAVTVDLFATSMSGFLRRHRSAVVDGLVKEMSPRVAPAAHRAIDHLCFVADTYDFAVTTEDEGRLLDRVRELVAASVPPPVPRSPVY